MAVNKVMLKSGKVLMDTSGVTVEPGMLYKGKTALNREGKLIEGTLEPGVANEVEQAVPQITVSAEGLVVAYATQEGGYVAAGTARSEMQLPVQVGKDVVPSMADQVAVEAGKYTTGAIMVKGDANLVPDNIAEGVSIFGVLGAFAGGGGGMSKFGGYPCETGTCIMTNGSCTIPHSLGTLKGAILMSQGKINGYTLVIVTLENTFNVALYSDGSGGDAMNSSMFSKNFWITANNTNSATIKLDMFFADAQNMNYILLGA